MSRTFQKYIHKIHAYIFWAKIEAKYLSEWNLPFTGRGEHPIKDPELIEPTYHPRHAGSGDLDAIALLGRGRDLPWLLAMVICFSAVYCLTYVWTLAVFQPAKGRRPRQRQVGLHFRATSGTAGKLCLIRKRL